MPSIKSYDKKLITEYTIKCNESELIAEYNRLHKLMTDNSIDGLIGTTNGNQNTLRVFVNRNNKFHMVKFHDASRIGDYPWPSVCVYKLPIKINIRDAISILKKHNELRRNTMSDPNELVYAIDTVIKYIDMENTTDKYENYENYKSDMLEHDKILSALTTVIDTHDINSITHSVLKDFKYRISGIIKSYLRYSHDIHAMKPYYIESALADLGQHMARYNIHIPKNDLKHNLLTHKKFSSFASSYITYSEDYIRSGSQHREDYSDVDMVGFETHV